jgi:hypothetical protein
MDDNNRRDTAEPSERRGSSERGISTVETVVRCTQESQTKEKDCGCRWSLVAVSIAYLKIALAHSLVSSKEKQL